MEESERSRFTKRKIGAGSVSNGTLTFPRDFLKNETKVGQMTQQRNWKMAIKRERQERSDLKRRNEE